MSSIKEKCWDMYFLENSLSYNLCFYFVCCSWWLYVPHNNLKSSKILWNILGVCGRLCNPSYWDDGIWGWYVDRESPKDSKWPAWGLHYTWGSIRGSVFAKILLGSDWIPICLGLHGCLMLSQALGLNHGSHGVRNDLT